MSHAADTAVLDRVLDPVARLLTPAVARGIVELRADPVLQSRLDELAEKASAGALTESEQHEYRDSIEAMDLLGLLQSKARAVLNNSDSK